MQFMSKQWLWRIIAVLFLVNAFSAYRALKNSQPDLSWPFIYTGTVYWEFATTTPKLFPVQY